MKQCTWRKIVEIKKIQGIIISSLFIAGLSGCSGSSSYTQNDSPWKAKHEAERADVVSEEFVEVSMDDALEVNGMDEAPVIEEVMPEPEMIESEMEAQQELESVADFDATLEPVDVETLPMEEMEPMPVETVEATEAVVTSSSDIMSASPSAYAVQVYAGRILSNVNRY